MIPWNGFLRGLRRPGARDFQPLGGIRSRRSRRGRSVRAAPPRRFRANAALAAAAASDAPSVLEDEPGQSQTCFRGQLSVSAGHEGLLCVKRFLRQLHSTSGGLGHSITSDRIVAGVQPTSLRSTARARCCRPALLQASGPRRAEAAPPTRHSLPTPGGLRRPRAPRGARFSWPCIWCTTLA